MKYFIGIILVLCIITLVNVIIESVRENRRISISNYKIKDRRIKHPARVVLISDLHNSQFGEKNQKLIKHIDILKPDFILVAGDLIVGKEGETVDIAVDLLNNLGERYPVYVGKGNHELRVSIYAKYGDMWKNLYEATKDKVTWLIDESVYLPNYNITIYGLDMDACFYRRLKKLYMPDSYLKDRLPELDKKSYSILIGHDPDYFEEYARWGADLSVSGHVHGGLINVPKLGGLVSPMVKFLPEYYKGMYSIDNKRMIVSAGLGIHTIKIRINNEPDLVTINLEK
jgi:hypothetical protein